RGARRAARRAGRRPGARSSRPHLCDADGPARRRRDAGVGARPRTLVGALLAPEAASAPSSARKGTTVNETRPLDMHVLNVARGIAGAYATRLLSDLGARASRLRWQDDRPGDWPASPGFWAYFDRGVESVTLHQTLG